MGSENPAESGASSFFCIMFNEIRSDKDVCSNCFQRIRERYERNYRLEPHYDEDESEWTVQPVDVQGLEVTVAGEDIEIGGLEDDVTRCSDSTTRIPERGAHRGMRTVCDCGYRPGKTERDGGTWKNRPLSKAEFFEYADNLVERIEGKGTSFSEDVFYAELDRMKSDPDQQFDDDRIYKRAIKKSILIERVREGAVSGSISG